MAFSPLLRITAFCLCCVLATHAQVTVVLSSDKTEVPAGETVNLTCSFEISKADFKEVKFSDNGNDFFTFVETTSGAQEGVTAYTAQLVDAADANSTVTITVKADLCGDDKATKRNYECTATKSDDTSGSDSESVDVTGDAVCGTPAAGAVGTTEDPAGDSGSNSTTPASDVTTAVPENLGLYGSAIALIIILILAAILGLIGLWYCCSVKKSNVATVKV